MEFYQLVKFIERNCFNFIVITLKRVEKYVKNSSTIYAFFILDYMANHT